MILPRLLFCLTLMNGVAATAQPQFITLEDFETRTVGAPIRGQGDGPLWRARGLRPENSGVVQERQDGRVLALGTRQSAIYDHPSTFAIAPGKTGTLRFNLRLPDQGVSEGQAFYLVAKTRAQADEDLTRPSNGVMLLQFAYVAAQKAYRCVLEGPGASPTAAFIKPASWITVWVEIDHQAGHYRVLVAPEGAAPKLVANHRYGDGRVPFKNRHDGAIELIYLRNQSLEAEVLLDDLGFAPVAVIPEDAGRKRR